MNARNLLNLMVIMAGLIFIAPEELFSQPQPVPLERLGLRNKDITAIGVYGNITAAGTMKHGVYWKEVTTIDGGDSSWNLVGLDSAQVYTVYPHKSGPLGWAIGAGIKPDSVYPHLVYCSFMGGAFEPRDQGISDSVAHIVHELDGFPDPSICGETYAATGGALYRRYFTDSVWVSIYTASSEGYVQTVKVHEESPGVVMTGGAEGITGILLLKSLDYGNSWIWLSPPSFVSDIDFTGPAADTIFIVATNVYLSLDGGTHWNEIFNTSWISIKKVIYHRFTSTIFIAGADNLGNGNAMCLYSKDVGNSWTNLLLDIANPVIDLVSGDDGWIYFATPDSGVYRFNPVIVGIEPDEKEFINDNFQLFQNYPNPFNSSTVINFYLKKSMKVKLSIVNVLGDEIRQLVDDQTVSGYGSVVWDGRDQSGNSVSSGIYLCQLKVTDVRQTKKMLLVR